MELLGMRSYTGFIMRRLFVVLLYILGVVVVRAQDITIPVDLVIAREPKPSLKDVVLATPVTLDKLTVGSVHPVFGTCDNGNYYLAFQLGYDLGDWNTQQNWAVDLSISLLDNNAAVLWTKSLGVKMSDQTFVSTVFHDVTVPCSSNYTIRIDANTVSGTPPPSNIFLKVLGYKYLVETFTPTTTFSVESVANGQRDVIQWNRSPVGVIAYDVEWVYIGKYEGFSGTPQNAFKFKEPVRVTVPAIYSYTRSRYYPDGNVWYRVRAVGYNPSYPEHRIPGDWFYAASPIAITNHQSAVNWQHQTIFAEEGKSKKIMTYFDGSLRQRQQQTNLSTSGDTTIVGESMYDYEGRKAIDVLPVPTSSTSLQYKPGVNAFLYTNTTVNTNTSAKRKKFHYDNDVLTNSTVSTADGAGKYYSTANTLPGFRADYIPNAEGYVYGQTEFLNDGTGRVKRQAGVGKDFRMDATGTANHTNRYYYGNAAPVELTRLFGTNVGNANHYKKNMQVEPNGQTSVSYLDQEGRVVATALAGVNPANVAPLASLTSLPNDKITVDLSTKNVRKDGKNTIIQKILNTVPNTVYDFVYSYSSLGSTIGTFGCVSCTFNLKITVTDPDGKLVTLPVIANNTVADNSWYERKGITAAQCNNPSTDNISFSLTFTQAGDYTVTKTLTVNDLTFEEAKTVVLQNTSVQEKIQQLQNSYVVDQSNCSICTEPVACLPEVEAEIEEAMKEIASLDCENIYTTIVRDLQASGVNVTDENIRAHAKYCQYELCLRDKESEIFEKRLARVTTWTEAVQKKYNLPLSDVNASEPADPFFSNALLGYNYRSSMQSKLNKVYVATIVFDANGDKIPDGTRPFFGTILQVTDPANTSFYINANGNIDAVNGYHILYYDLMSRKSSMTASVYQAELDRQRWQIFKSFYLEAKRKTKLEITEYVNCPSVKTDLERTDKLPSTESDIKAWGEANGVTDGVGVTGPVSDDEINTIITNIQFNCGQVISDTEKASIANSLRLYFNSNPRNFLRLILKNDLATNQNLIAIKNILSPKGCGLDSLAQDDFMACAEAITVSFTDNVYSVTDKVPSAGGGDPNCSGDGCQTCRTGSESEMTEEEMLQEFQTNQNSVVTSSVKPSESEYKALWDLYYSLNGPQWRSEDRVGWSTADPNVVQDVTGWSGVTTNADGHVIGFDLQFKDGVTGTIPHSIGNLSYLEILFIQYGLTGTIPSEVGNLIKLKQLTLSYNTSLTGSIPYSLGGLYNLTHCSLHSNNLTGSIPDVFGNISSLVWLRLQNNQLTGTIPLSLGRLQNLTSLDLSYNNLTGNIPIEIGDLACHQASIVLNNNALYGIVPYKLRNTNNLRLQSNRFTYVDLEYVIENWKGIKPPFYSPQALVDVARTVTVSKTQSLTLSTFIDRTVASPACTYQWFKNGTAINTESTTGHTITINNVSDADAGDYYYVIKLLGSELTLRSNIIKVVPVIGNIRTITVCKQYDSANVTLQKLSFNPDWQLVINKCLADAAAENALLFDYTKNKIIDEEASLLYSQRFKCLDLNETFTYAYIPKEYHYTLYYYDQAGNLVQTVPPEGVNLQNPGAHRYVTRYQYNSLNQSIWQKTPDAGESRFWYNEKGQVRLSQNAQQIKDNNYSYTKYDKQGRVVEVGEMNTTASLISLLTQLEDAAFPSGTVYTLSDITNTYYDLPNAAIQATFTQQFLRNRVSWVEVRDKVANDVIATYYSYDIHGNVKSLLQQVPGLASKRVDYVYDLVSGNVNYVMYQYGQPDQLIHRYRYDADNRIREVATSTDGYWWNQEATYKYYLHGPLARVEMGHYRVQGLDYYYTLQGWIKGVNMPYAADPGNDGYTGANLRVGRDVFAYTLGYFEGDYKPRNTTRTLADTRDQLWARYKTLMGSTNTGLYNGNISWMITDLKKIGQQKAARVKGMQAMLYKYDQLHRISQSRSLTGYTTAGFTARTTTPAAYDEDFTYDANGNILTLKRRNDAAVLADDFVYTYYTNTNKLRYHIPFTRDTVYSGAIENNNKVYRNITVKGTAYAPAGKDAVIKATDNIDIDEGFDIQDNATFHAYVLPEDEGAYNYDAIGNLIWDQGKGVKISWTPYGKVRQVTKGNGAVITFRYDGTGNRIEKKMTRPDKTTVVTRYVRDASGNVMATYSGQILKEQPIYGSSRLGQYKGGNYTAQQTLGNRNFELSNHLGNVLSTITDNIGMATDSTWATVSTTSDYYAFGSSMPGREFSASSLSASNYALTLSGTAHSKHDATKVLSDITNTFTVECWVNPTTTHQVDAQTTTGTTGIAGQRYAIYPTAVGTTTSGEAGMGISVGTNGVSVYEHSQSFMPPVLVWSGTISGWTHIAVVYTNGVPTLYVNGAVVKTGVKSAKTKVYPSCAFMGGFYGSMPGAIDEVRIWNAARTASELQTNYAKTVPANTPNLAGYWPFNEGNNALVHDISQHGLDQVLINRSTWSVANTGAPVTKGGPAVISDEDAHYPLNADGKDVSGNNRNGTVNGAVPTADKYNNENKALQFDGVDDHVLLANTKDGLAYIQNTGVFTISAFVKISDLNARCAIAASTNSSTGKGFFFMYENYDETAGIHQLRFAMMKGVSGQYSVAKGAKYTINDNEWHHVAVVGDGQTIKFYVDGVQDGPATTITQFSTGTSSEDAVIGGLPNVSSTAVAQSMKGAIDEVYIYKKALTQNEVVSLVNGVNGNNHNDELMYLAGYPYGFNGQEEDRLLMEDLYYAEYWEYDSRIGRRWNIDPVVKPWESPYSVLFNSPILHADPSGLNGEPQTHKVKDGDTYSKIAKQYNVTVDQLRAWNEYEDTKIPIGAELIVSDPYVNKSEKLEPRELLPGLKTTNLVNTTFTCHPKEVDYETLGIVQGTLVSTGVSFTAAGPYQDLITAVTGKDVFTGEEVSGFRRYTGVVPFVSEARALKYSLKALKTLAVLGKCDKYAKSFMKKTGTLMKAAGAKVTHKRIKIGENKGLIGTATENYGNNGWHEFVEVEYNGQTYIYDNMNSDGILKSDYIEKIGGYVDGKVFSGEELLKDYTNVVK
jgi:Leucine-rich repeat (LRR) protein